jgi:hypothetical protein
MTPDKPDFHVSWDPARGYVATCDRGPGRREWHVAADPLSALGGLRERIRMLLGEVLGAETGPGAVAPPNADAGSWLDDGGPWVCPIHLRHGPCRDPHYSTPYGDAPYVNDPLLVVATTRYQSAGGLLSVDEVLHDVYRIRRATARWTADYDEREDPRVEIPAGTGMVIEWVDGRSAWAASTSPGEGTESVSRVEYGDTPADAVGRLAARIRGEQPLTDAVRDALTAANPGEADTVVAAWDTQIHSDLRDQPDRAVQAIQTWRQHLDATVLDAIAWLALFDGNEDALLAAAWVAEKDTLAEAQAYVDEWRRLLNWPDGHRYLRDQAWWEWALRRVSPAHAVETLSRPPHEEHSPQGSD